MNLKVWKRIFRTVRQSPFCIFKTDYPIKSNAKKNVFVRGGFWTIKFFPRVTGCPFYGNIFHPLSFTVISILKQIESSFILFTTLRNTDWLELYIYGLPVRTDFWLVSVTKSRIHDHKQIRYHYSREKVIKSLTIVMNNFSTKFSLFYFTRVTNIMRSKYFLREDLVCKLYHFL